MSGITHLFKTTVHIVENKKNPNSNPKLNHTGPKERKKKGILKRTTNAGIRNNRKKENKFQRQN